MVNLNKIPNYELFNQSLGDSLVKNIQKYTRNKFSDEEKKKILQASRDFEAFFNYMVFKGLRKALLSDITNDDASNEFGRDIFNDLTLMELSRHLSKSGAGIGIADKIFFQLTGEKINMLKFDNPVKKKAEVKNNITQNHNKIQELLNTSALQNQKPKTKLPDSIKERITQFENIINRVAEKYQISKPLLQSIIAVESGGNPLAVSPKGAKGLMQLIDSTAKYVGVQNVFNPFENIEGGARYLREMLDTFEGNLELALAAYNAGPRNVIKYNGVPPFAETRNYINRVKRYISIFSNNL